MAELSLSGASTQGGSAVQDEDGDFEPSADMLVHDFDDEQTLEEEEMLQGETNFTTEIDDLTREGEMPIHELLKMYGYGGGDSAEEEDEGAEEQEASEIEQASTAQGNIKSDKEEKVKDQQDTHSSSDESEHCKRTHSTAQLLCSESGSYFDGNDADESEDEDYIPSEHWKKEVKVGPMYQAETPTELCQYEDNEKVFENDDQLLWNPELLPEKEVVEYLAEASKRAGENTGVETVPEKPLIKDNEQALYELVKCNFNKEEALSRLKFTAIPAKEDMSFWTEDENRDFEQGDEACGSDHSLAEANKQIKLWRRKPSLHPGVMDSGDKMLNETESSEIAQGVTHPFTSSCSGSQLESENTATNKNADFHSSEQPVVSVGDHTADQSCTNGSSHTLLNTEDTHFNSSYKPDSSSPSEEVVRRLVRQREDEESSEKPLKRQKTEVEFLTTEAVSGSRIETV